MNRSDCWHILNEGFVFSAPSFVEASRQSVESLDRRRVEPHYQVKLANATIFVETEADLENATGALGAGRFPLMCQMALVALQLRRGFGRGAE